MHALTLTHKHDGTGGIFLLQQVFQQLNLVLEVISAIVPLMNFFTLAGRRRRRHFYRIFQQALGKVFNRFTFEGRGEQQRLFTPAGFTGDMLDILGEAHVQHTVCFVEDQRLNGAAVEVFFFNVLQQTTGRRHHDILVFAEHFGVVHIRNATGDGRDIQVRVFCQLASMIGDLHRQFTRRREDQDARRARFFARKVEQVLQRRQQIRRCFTGAGWRRTENITSIERRRNGGSLNGSRACKAFALEGFQKAFVKFKFGKSRYSHDYLCVRR